MLTVWPETALPPRVTVTVNPPGAAGTELVSSASSKVILSVAPSTVGMPDTSGARVSGVTVTSSASARKIAAASLPAASRIFAPEPGGVYSSVTFAVPSAIAAARLSVAVEPATDTAFTAGPSVLPIRTTNPPAPVGTDDSSRASDQITVTVGPATAAWVALGRMPSTVRAVSASTASWASCTSRLPAAVRIALPVGVASAFAGIAIPSVSASSSTTAYSKRSLALPEPDT